MTPKKKKLVERPAADGAAARRLARQGGWRAEAQLPDLKAASSKRE